MADGSSFGAAEGKGRPKLGGGGVPAVWMLGSPEVAASRSRVVRAVVGAEVGLGNALFSLFSSSVPWAHLWRGAGALSVSQGWRTPTTFLCGEENSGVQVE